jgi:hypothetical protein
MLISISLGLFVVIGSRAALLGALIFGAWMMLQEAKGLKSQLWVFMLTLIVLLSIHTFLRTLRGFGISGLMQAYSDGNFFKSLFAFALDKDTSITGGETDIPEAFMFAVANNSITDFGFMTSIQRLILLPLPSIEGLLLKPMDVTNTLWAKAFQQGFFSNDQGQAGLLESFLSGSFGSMHATIFGEYFLSGGWLGFVISMFLLGIVFVVIDYVLCHVKPITSLLLSGPILIGYFFSARGNSVIGIGYFVYLGVLVILLKYSYYKIRLLYTTSKDLKNVSKMQKGLS